MSVVRWRNTYLIDKKLKCGFDPKVSSSTRSKRSAVHGFSQIDSNTRFVELILVNDFRVFHENGRSVQTLHEENKKIANIINAYYRQLNVIVILVDIVIWEKYDEIEITPNTNRTLREFLHYREVSLVPKIKHDNAQLITGVKLEGDIVGKAIKGGICDTRNSGGINYYHSKVISLIATTIAHEMGHNFGMEHDGKGCECPKKSSCIMAESVSHMSPTAWSSCSKKVMNSVFSRASLECLRDEPSKVIGPSCGNGVLESGEECDCDQPSCSKCCDQKTCKLKPGAECGTGICCDLDNCKIIKENKVCRSARSDCDVVEYCDGKSEFCPKNAIKHNGYECSDGYCFNGHCISNEKHCKSLWGAEAIVADDACFQYNVKGQSDGNCGYDYEQNRFIPCYESNVLCGLLFCDTFSQTLFYDGEYTSATLSTRTLTSSTKKVQCRSTIIKNGRNFVNPGLVPNGGSCGKQRICVNQQCVNVSEVFDSNRCPSCGKNQICGNDGVCHCAIANCDKSSLATIGYIALILLILIGIAAISYYQYNKRWRRRKPTLSPKSGKAPRGTQIGRSLPISAPLNTMSGVSPNNQISTISKKVQRMPHRPAPPPPPPPSTKKPSATASNGVHSIKLNATAKDELQVKFVNRGTQGSGKVSQLTKMFEQNS
ncbi:disintegrin and metalloproteinase domain-containing protein 12-like protein [Dinothrombium tinctorium]|uniref:Disintegrin and metalloproteinase domain-containing protein 12-like protein n=1 Tax=Dinothrombium tinctorium TaxID=1965070 RepID=A0A3S3P869_9ACAR|nr:disintegrin and metalloproteinase domain-containing protein 12-like protein [Dinothrombium tinctorium]